MIRLNQHNSTPPVGINVMPLVDVIFILLIFFLLTSHVQQGLVLDLPAVKTSETVTQQYWMVSITAEDQLQFNGIDIEKTALKKLLLMAQKKVKSRRLIVLNMDKHATVDTLVFVMDTVRQIGLYNLVISTETAAETEVINDQ
ncbi:ExbD/TolR family protein [Shewanella algicola]|uniref:ExbD/TolR family protein n=1 Tax=Shewanella algicola TaxID=640633 RepID=UPI0024955BA4|nr:biopolymer transporter ExbD [Shewanella algicola]